MKLSGELDTGLKTKAGDARNPFAFPKFLVFVQELRSKALIAKKKTTILSTYYPILINLTRTSRNQNEFFNSFAKKTWKLESIN